MLNTTAAERREAFLLGSVVGATLAFAPASGRRHAAIALGDGLIEELLGGGVDLRRLAGRWTDWWAADGQGIDAALQESLAHLKEFDAPAPARSATGSASISAALPAALAGASPRSMLSGGLHTARLLEPDPEAALAVVTVVVAAAAFLEGRRDMIGDVLGVLRMNNAPATVLDRFAAIARDPRAPAPVPKGDAAHPVDVALWVLRLAEHRPRSHEVLAALPGSGVNVHAAAALGALLGARDGLANWPPEWFTADAESIMLRRGVAAQLNS